MDDMLKEFAKQAGFSVRDGECYSPFREEYSIDDLLEYFALRVIVKCMDIVAECDTSGMMELKEPYATIINKIENHFKDIG